MQEKIHGMGLKSAPTDKHGFHFHASAPHPGLRVSLCVSVCSLLHDILLFTVLFTCHFMSFVSGRGNIYSSECSVASICLHMSALCRLNCCLQSNKPNMSGHSECAKFQVHMSNSSACKEQTDGHTDGHWTLHHSSTNSGGNDKTNSRFNNYQGAIIFTGRGAVCLWGGQNFLGWSKGGTSFFQ